MGDTISRWISPKRGMNRRKKKCTRKNLHVLHPEERNGSHESTTEGIYPFYPCRSGFNNSDRRSSCGYRQCFNVSTQVEEVDETTRVPQSPSLSSPWRVNSCHMVVVFNNICNAYLSSLPRGHTHQEVDELVAKIRRNLHR